MGGEEVAIAAFHALPTGAVNFGAPLVHAPVLAMGAGTCFSVVHCSEPTTVARVLIGNTAVGKRTARLPGGGAISASGGGRFTAPGRGLHMG